VKSLQTTPPISEVFEVFTIDFVLVFGGDKTASSHSIDGGD
jgi:hypothetical protein